MGYRAIKKKASRVNRERFGEEKKWFGSFRSFNFFRFRREFVDRLKGNVRFESVRKYY